jgi:lipopolysaccharide/colanic/teichoic acid biosynthesis glycosyltransferase
MPYVIAVAAVHFLIYFLTVRIAGYIPLQASLIVAIALGLVPVGTAIVLTALRRQEAPILVSLVVSLAVFSFSVSGLSAARIEMSYQAIAYCLPVVLVGMALGNLRFHQTLNLKATLLPFSRSLEIASELGDVAIASGPDMPLDGVQLLLIDPEEHHNSKWSPILSQAYLSSVEVMPWTRFMEVKRGRLDIDSFEVANLTYSPSQLLYARAKRILDYGAVFVSLPITVPLAALVALYILLCDGGPVLFVQVRRGYGGRRFRMYKFRTMYKGTGGGSTRANDRRIIPGCKLIRKLRLDELPQLVNILRGDMSLIGPRPVAEYVSRSSEKVEPKYALRSLVLPGITGWAQVKSGYAATIEEEIEKLSYDLYYIKNLSVDLDLLVLFKTIKTVMFGTGR